jgi:hypothetical protein
MTAPAPITTPAVCAIFIFPIIDAGDISAPVRIRHKRLHQFEHTRHPFLLKNLEALYISKTNISTPLLTYNILTLLFRRNHLLSSISDGACFFISVS